ncbi:MAG: hypothetical protein EI684_10370 [Candidatus Viridilinea halotolerans]|uniref:Bacteriocin immunity protein n=1 Tax=Candidatus Viridilinea halotolerans TaxID=2491704 RepID=A0A426U0D0_9CHLR|nr:MAG: hypothetical protein EI684_10370 [Candidatus Viridilinea halotolerans]
MTPKLNKSELIELVDKLLQAEGSEEEEAQWLELIKRNVSDPNVIGLIYWSNQYGLSEEPSAKEIVEKAISYKPIAL